MKKIAADRNYKIMKKAGMKVYVVTSVIVDYHTMTDIIGVYSSLEKAREAKEEHGSGIVHIVETTLDDYYDEDNHAD